MSGKLLHFSVATAVSPKPLASTLLVGRVQEVAFLHQRLATALAGQRQVVFLAGEPGIGKTALLDAFLTQVRDRADLRITLGQCVEQYGPGEAYLPLLEATTRLCRGTGGERWIELLQRYAPSWLAQLPSLVEPHEFDQLQQRIQGVSRERMLREMAEAAELFTTQQGLIVVLEDLHWSDVSTLDWLTYMARRREPARLLILSAYRPAEVASGASPLRRLVQELQAQRQCEELALSPLPTEAIRAYVRERFGSLVLPENVMAMLAHRTDGNPLFLINMVEDLIRQGVLVKAGEHWGFHEELGGELAGRAPESLRQLIERRLERLSEEEQGLLEAASVAGVEFAGAEAAGDIQSKLEAVEARCERLVHAGQWLRAAGVAEWPDGTLSGRYSFLHAVYHEVVYGRVAEARRIQLHRRIAERKEAAYGARAGEIAAELAMHYEKGRDLQRAVQYLDQAGRNAVRRSAHREAIAHSTKGLDLLTICPEAPERSQQELQLHLTLGTSLMATKGYAAPELERVYTRARELCQQLRTKETPQLLFVLGGLWTFYQVRAQFRTAHELAKEIVTLAHSLQRPTSLLWAHLWMGETLFGLGELRSGCESLEQSLKLYNPGKHSPRVAPSPHDPGETGLAYSAWTLWLLGYPDQALERIQKAQTLAQEIDHPFSLAHALNFAAWLHQARGEFLLTQEHAEQGRLLSEDHGYGYRRAQSIILQGWALAKQGQEEEGLSWMHEGLSAWQTTGAEQMLPCYLALLAETYSKAGRIAEGLTALSQAVERVNKTGEYWYEAELSRLQGELTLEQFNVQGSKSQDPTTQYLALSSQGEAEVCFLKALTIARRQAAKSWELRTAMSLARLWQSQGKVADARQLLEEIYNWFTEGFDTKDLQEAAALLAALGGRIESAESRKESRVVRSQRSLASGEREERHKAKIEDVLSTPNAQRPTPDIPRSSTQDSRLSPQHFALFRCDGEYWTLSFAGKVCRLDDMVGLHYLAQLLQHPRQKFSAVTLAGGSRKSSATAPNGALTPSTKAADRQRLADLQAELTEAQNFYDLGRIERLETEIETLTQSLTQTLQQSTRAMAVSSEQARLNVTRAIRRTLQKITVSHPALGQYLTQAIKMGVICVYTPQPYPPLDWQFS